MLNHQFFNVFIILISKPTLVIITNWEDLVEISIVLCWQSWQRGRLVDTSCCGLPHYSNNNIILPVPLSDTHPGQMHINTSTSYIIKVPAAATSTTSLSFPRGGVSSIVQSSILSNQIMRDVDVPVLSPSPHVISHLISSWTDVFSSSVCQYTTTLTERITVTHADSSPSKRARERDWWIVEIA